MNDIPGSSWRSRRPLPWDLAAQFESCIHPVVIVASVLPAATGPLGIAVVGGMTFATLLGLFLAPALDLIFADSSRPDGHIARALTRLEAVHPLSPRGTQPAE